jgi:uncharacterized repeat protein (TIGR01451 family)/LPXTG-motif cell wall-anchored protein
MNTTSQLTAKVGRGLRLTIATVLAVPLTFGALSQPAVATTTLVVDTDFLVDGLLTDFTSPYGPGITPDGYPTTGMYYVDHTEAGSPPEVELCNDDADDVGASGEKVQTGPVWSTATGKVTPTTVDVDDFWVAGEKVLVPTSGGGSTIHDFLYLGFDLCDTKNGSFTLGIFVEGGDGLVPFNADGTATGSTDDYLIVFDFPSTTVGDTLVYRFGTTNWNNEPTVVSGAVQGTLFNPRSSGEVAIDLTQANIFSNLPGAPAGTVDRCRTLTVQGPIASLAGGALNSDIKDLVSIDPFVIDNCGEVDIAKVSASGATSSPEFFYDVEQVDLGAVHDQSLTPQFGEPEIGPAITPTDNNTEIDAPISVGDLHSWSNVIAQQDYLLSERTPLPVGWELTSITCSYYDIFTDTYVEDEVLYDPLGGYQNMFAVAPSSLGNVDVEAASCTIENDAAGIIIEKVGLPANSDQEFTFDVNGADHTLTIGESEFIPLEAGTEVTLSEDVPAGWTLDSIECFNDDGTEYLTSDTGSIEITSDDSSNPITCVFTNTQLAKLTVAKIADPNVGTFEFDVTGPNSFADGFSVLAGGSEVVGTDYVEPGTYNITETLPAATPPWSLNNVDCGDWALGDTDTTITLAPGADVTCTFSNARPGRIVIDKALDIGNGTFTFTGHTFAGGNSISIVNGVEVVGDELVANVIPGVYNINETVPPGFTLVSVVCGDATGNTTVNAAGASINVAAGETVSCLFTNSRNTGSFTLVKNWGDSTALDTVRLTATVAGPEPLDTVAAATSTAPNDGVSIQVDTASGQTVTFGEDTFANGAAYNTSLSCVDGEGRTVQPTTVGALNRSGTYAVGDTPFDMTCTLTNSLKTAGVVLQKVWDDPAAGATASLTVAVPARSVSNSATSESFDPPVFESAASADDNSAFIPVLVGDVVTFTESLGAQASNYVTTFACFGAVNQPVKITDYQYQLTIAAGDAGQQPICRFTNTRKSVAVVVAKDWNNAVPGDAVTILAGGSVTPISFGAVAVGSETDTSGAFTVYAGETLTFSESWTTGDSAAYSTSFSCTGADTATDGILSIPATGGTITCTYVNSRRSVNVQVAKDLVPSADNGRFDLSINGVQRVDAAGDNATSAPVSVFVGDAVTFSELADALSPALTNYNSTFACNSGIVPPINTGTTGGFTVPSSLASNTTVTCTFTNTRKQANLVVTKSWGNSPVGNGTVDLAITGFVGGNDPGVNSNDAVANDDDANATIYAGETVSVSEAFTNGAAANHNTSLACVDASGNLVSSTGQLSGGFTVAATPTDVTCTFTNVRKQARLTLHKNWINGQAGDQALLTITGQSGEAPATDTSTSLNGSLNDVDNTASLTVYAGETVTVTEALGAAGAKYDTTLFCSVAAPTVTPGTLNRAGTVAVTAANEGQSINCTFHNSRKSIVLELDKDWMQSPVTGDTVELTLTGGLLPASPFGSLVDPAVDSDDGVANDQIATVQAFYGDTISLAETFTVGAAANYDSTLTCGAGNTPNSGTYFVHPATAAADSTVRCTFHNQRKSVTLTLDKAWVDAVAGDTAELTANGIADDSATSTAPAVAAAGNTAEITAYAGETVTLSEIITSATASYASALECAAEPITYTAGATTGTIAISPAQADGPAINCTFTNRARRGTIVVEKSVVGVDNDTFDFTGTWLSPTGFDITTSGAGQSGSVTYPGVLIGTYSVTEVAPTPQYDGTSLSCVESAGGDNDSSSLGLVGTIDLDDGETVTCSYTNTQRARIIIQKETLPNGSPQPFNFNATYTDDFALSDGGSLTSAWITPGVEYSVSEDALTGWDLTSIVCSSNVDGSANAGVKIVGEIDLTPAAGEVVTCAFTNTQRAEIVIDKVTIPADDPQQFGFEANWDGNSDAPADFGLTHAAAAVSSGFIVPGTPYTVTEAALGGWTLTGLDCSGSNASENPAGRTAVVTPAPGETVTCTFTNTKRGAAVVEKALDPEYVDGAIQVTPVNPLSPNVFQVEYDLTVTSTSFANETFIIEDEFDFGAGTTIDTWSIDRTSLTGPEASPTWNGGAAEPADLVAVTGTIMPGATYTYHVVATFTVDPAMTLVARDCESNDGLGGTGTLNTATAITGGISLPPSSACAEIPGPAITVTKTATADSATFLGDEVYSVSYDVVVTNTGDGPGAYTLNDQPDFADGVDVLLIAGLPAGSIGIEAGGVDNYTVTVTFSIDGASSAVAAECADGPGGVNQGTYNLITVNSQSGPDTGEDCADIPTFDLELVKADGGATGVAGGAPFEYTISVRNVGERDADASDPVTVTDTLPAGLVWVAVPANCEVDGQVVTCDLDPTLLGVGDPAVVITATVRASADTAAGTYTNVAVVTTEDDPVCVGAGCVPPPCPAIGNNNVDCEDTPVTRASDIEIVKTDDVADGAHVAPGQSFTYSLVVTNLGPSTILPGLTVSDDLPAQLTLVSVTGGAGWTCNNSDPIACTYAPSLAPGAAAPAITVEVRVSADASGSSIVNEATATGTSDGTTPVTDTDDETTPLALSADLAIIKTSSIDVVGEGGSFDWILTVTNNGPGAASNVVINDTVPGEVTIMSVSSSAFVCANAGNELTCTRGSLSVGASGTITVTVQVKAGNTSTSTANVGRVISDTPDPDFSNNSDDDLVNIVVSQPPPPLPPPLPELPQTGSNIAGVVTTAMWLLLMGGALILITRRRRRQPAA